MHTLGYHSSVEAKIKKLNSFLSDTKKERDKLHSNNQFCEINSIFYHILLSNEKWKLLKCKLNSNGQLTGNFLYLINGYSPTS